MSFNQNLHFEQDIEERLDLYWDFKPSDGGVRNQAYVVMSIVAPEGTNQRAPSFGIKVFGCFTTVEEATEYSKKLQSECDFFDFYVMKTLEWAKLPPVVEKLEDVHYQESELETLKKNVLKMREGRKKLMEQRVLDARKDAKKKKAALMGEPIPGDDDNEDGGEQAPPQADGGVQESKTGGGALGETAA